MKSDKRQNHEKNTFFDVIGLMSGTSLDGLDVAYVRFEKKDEWGFTLIEGNSFPFDWELLGRLERSVTMTALELKQLDIDFGLWIGQKVKRFIVEKRLHPTLVVSHGHTVFHQPEKGITLQIGDGYRIMNETGITTVCDLRSLDVSLGGQGAPLVPVGDKLLFGEYDFCLNLGGFSNISFDEKNKRIAFDICPVNTVLNHLSLRIGIPFDKNGDVGRNGQLNKDLLQKLNSLNYYRLAPPKSLGIEWVEENIFPLLRGDAVEDLLHTFCHHIAEQIVRSMEKLSFSHGNIPRMLVTGGGAKNIFLIELIREKSGGKFNIIIPDEKIIDFKEAIIFAFLGLLRYLGEINCLSSVTGAARDSSGGLIYDHFGRKSPRV